VKHWRASRWAMLPIAMLLAGGCARPTPTIASTFPTAHMATPWVLDGEVWSGSFFDAAPALGPDEADWRPFKPTRVWLAVYRHETETNRKLTLRAFAFATAGAAQQAYEQLRPPLAKDFKAGDEGCWTEIGVMFRWGRLIYDIFGAKASWHSEVQSASVASFVLNHMPPGLPDSPQ
jgi:hypothetical protein